MKRWQTSLINKEQQRFGLRKLSVGVASVLLGTTVYFGLGGTVVHADSQVDTVSSDTGSEETNSNLKVPYAAPIEPAQAQKVVNSAVNYDSNVVNSDTVNSNVENTNAVNNVAGNKTANEASPKPADSVTTAANKAANYDYSYTNPDLPAATAPTIDSNGIQTSADTQSSAFVHIIYYKDKVSGQDVQAPSVIKVWYTRNPKVPSEHLNDPGAMENGGIPYGDWHFHKMTITGSPVETAGTDVQPMTPENTPEMTPKFNRVLPRYGSGENISTAEQFVFSAPWIGPDLAGYQRLGSTNYLTWTDFVPDKFHSEAGEAVYQTIYYIKEKKTTKQVNQDLTFTLHYKYFDGDKAGQTAAPDKTITIYFTQEETTIKTPKIENGNIIKDADGNVEYDTKVTNGPLKLDTTKGDGKGYVTSDGSQWNIADAVTHPREVLTLDNWNVVPVIDGYVLGSMIVNDEDKVDYPTTVRGSFIHWWGNPNPSLGWFSDDNPSYAFHTDHTAYYFQVGKIVPIDENGMPIKGADTPSYPNDPNNPQWVEPNEPVPTIPGYHVDDSDNPALHINSAGGTTVTPQDSSKDTNVKYVKDDAKATVTFIDDTTGNTLTVDTLNGKATDPIDFSQLKKDLTNYLNQGYELVSNDMPDQANYDTTLDTDNPSQAYVIHLKHQVENVTDNRANTMVINTIHYKDHDTGKTLLPDTTFTADFHRDYKVDKVTGKETFGTWQYVKGSMKQTGTHVDGITEPGAADSKVHPNFDTLTFFIPYNVKIDGYHVIYPGLNQQWMIPNGEGYVGVNQQGANITVEYFLNDKVETEYQDRMLVVHFKDDAGKTMAPDAVLDVRYQRNKTTVMSGDEKGKISYGDWNFVGGSYSEDGFKNGMKAISGNWTIPASLGIVSVQVPSVDGYNADTSGDSADTDHVPANQFVYPSFDNNNAYTDKETLYEAKAEHTIVYHQQESYTVNIIDDTTGQVLATSGKVMNPSHQGQGVNLSWNVDQTGIGWIKNPNGSGTIMHFPYHITSVSLPTGFSVRESESSRNLIGDDDISHIQQLWIQILDDIKSYGSVITLHATRDQHNVTYRFVNQDNGAVLGQQVVTGMWGTKRNVSLSPSDHFFFEKNSDANQIADFKQEDTVVDIQVRPVKMHLVYQDDFDGSILFSDTLDLSQILNEQNTGQRYYDVARLHVNGDNYMSVGYSGIPDGDVITGYQNSPLSAQNVPAWFCHWLNFDFSKTGAKALDGKTAVIHLQHRNYNVVIKYLDLSGSQVGSQTVTGQWGSTQKVGALQVPQNYVLESVNVPTEVEIQPEDTELDLVVVPALIFRSYVDSKDADLHHSVTRTINITRPDKSIQTVVQTVVFGRNAWTNKKTGEITYSDWVPEAAPDFVAYVAPQLDGYVPGAVESMAADPAKDNVVADVAYTALPQAVSHSYIDVNGQTYDSIPTGYKVVVGQNAKDGAQLIVKDVKPTVPKIEYVTRTITIVMPNHRTRTIKQRVVKGHSFLTAHLPKLRGYETKISEDADHAGIGAYTADHDVNVTVVFTK